jgi:hypothetical protein
MASARNAAFGVIADAREHQQRQRRRLIALALAICAAGAFTLQLSGGGSPRGARVAPTARPERQPAIATIASVGMCWFPAPLRHSAPLFSEHCKPATRARLLAPGIVTVASGTAPQHDPWRFDLQRVRAQGVVLLCTESRPVGAGQCLPYPDQPYANRVDNPPLNGSPPVVLVPGVGNCAAPVWNLIPGLVMHPNLAIYFRSPDGTRRARLVALDPRLGVPGGAFASIITHGPVTLIARDRTGRIVYTTPVTNSGDKPTFCNGLDGGDWRLMTPAQARADLRPIFEAYPFGRWVRAATG